MRIRDYHYTPTELKERMMEVFLRVEQSLSFTTLRRKTFVPVSYLKPAYE